MSTVLDHSTPADSQLGKKTEYIAQYTPELLFPISRAPQRETLNISDTLPFYGHDVWNAYELSWLNSQGKPQVAIARFEFSCRSTHIIESKSMKLYLNSFNNTCFENTATVINTIQHDIEKATKSHAKITLQLLHDAEDVRTEALSGTCLDALDIAVDTYQVNPNYLITEPMHLKEQVYTNLLKSNCLATGQPDWASLRIRYSGQKIQHEGLLKYIISYRNHSEFAEHCVERIFMDIQQRCQPETLTVEAFYTRRGGLDINPLRSTDPETKPFSIRQLRQ